MGKQAARRRTGVHVPAEPAGRITSYSIVREGPIAYVIYRKTLRLKDAKPERIPRVHKTFEEAQVEQDRLDRSSNPGLFAKQAERGAARAAAEGSADADGD